MTWDTRSEDEHKGACGCVALACGRTTTEREPDASSRIPEPGSADTALGSAEIVIMERSRKLCAGRNYPRTARYNRTRRNWGILISI
eukprot:scaffold8776_cov124-Isochrysis_galbana.AAC.4